MCCHVPVPTVSVVDFTAALRRGVSVAETNEAHRVAAVSGPLACILQYTEEPLVSSDLKGRPYSSIFCAVDTIGLGNLVKVVAWYDNEWGYAKRISDLMKFLSDKVCAGFAPGARCGGRRTQGAGQRRTESHI